MPKKILKFPDGFLWGAAASSHQVEGGNYNNWTEWENKNARQLAEKAKVSWQKWQLKKFPEILAPENYISGRACDHYNRFEEDFDIAKSLGHNAHRFSIEWSRVEPEEGKFDEKEIDHYKKIISALRKREIEPFVTLWHWTDPAWITAKGGWENKKTIEYFSRYAEKIAASLNKEVKFWLPINEPTVYTGMSYIMGAFPPCLKNLWKANKVLNNLLSAYKSAYRIIHGLNASAMVGNAYNLHYHLPFRRWHPIDKFLCKLLHYIRDTRPLNKTKKCEDFIGLNYYFLDTIKFSLKGGYFFIAEMANPHKNVSDLNWDICPEGIYHLLLYLKKFKKPIYITENGLADKFDEKRGEFIKSHLLWIYQAIKKGADVRGYLHWSLLDNFEWDKGFWPRFGLVEINYKTLERKIRPSAKIYAEICKNNGLEYEE
jgi:beta-glucosidase